MDIRDDTLKIEKCMLRITVVLFANNELKSSAWHTTGVGNLRHADKTIKLVVLFFSYLDTTANLETFVNSYVCGEHCNFEKI